MQTASHGKHRESLTENLGKNALVLWLTVLFLQQYHWEVMFNGFYLKVA